MKNIVYIIIAILVLSSCGQSHKIEDNTDAKQIEDTALVPDSLYRIVSEQETVNKKFNINKCNIEIELKKKLTEDELKEIALKLRSTRQSYDYLWIFYLMPGMQSGAGAWATTHFTPGLEVEIMGSTDIQDKETSKTSDIKGKILGKWRCDKSLSGATLILYKSTDDKIIMRLNLTTGSKIDEEVTQSKTHGKTSYMTGNKHGEFYVLESNGNLGMYDGDGKYDEAKKID